MAKNVITFFFKSDTSDAEKGMGRLKKAVKSTSDYIKGQMESAGKKIKSFANEVNNAKGPMAKLKVVGKAAGNTIAAGTKKMKSGMETVWKRTEKLRGGMVKLGKIGAKALVGLAGAATAVVAGFVKMAGELDATLKKSIELGASAEGYQAIQFAAEKAGLSSEEMNAALKKTGESASRNADAWKELGIEIFDANGNMKNTDQLYTELQGQLAGMSDEQKNAAIQSLGMNEAMGALNRTMADNGAFMEDMKTGAENAIPEDTLLAAAAFNDALTNIKNSLQPIITMLFNFLAPIMMEMVRIIQEVVVPAVISFTEMFTQEGGKFTDVLQTMKDIFVSVWDFIVGLWNDYKDDIFEIIDLMVDMFQEFWSMIGAMWDKYGEDIMRVFKRTFDNILKFLRGFIRVFKGIFQIFKGLFSGDWEAMWEGIKNVFGGVIDMISGLFDQFLLGVLGGLKLAVKTVLNVVIGLLNLLIAPFNALLNKVDKGLKKLGGKGFSWRVPTIPLLAEGGILTGPTLNVAGEAGPEAVIPLDRLSSMINAEASGEGHAHPIYMDGEMVAQLMTKRFSYAEGGRGY